MFVRYVHTFGRWSSDAADGLQGRTQRSNLTTHLRPSTSSTTESLTSRQELSSLLVPWIMFYSCKAWLLKNANRWSGKCQCEQRRVAAPPCCAASVHLCWKASPAAELRLSENILQGVLTLKIPGDWSHLRNFSQWLWAKWTETLILGKGVVVVVRVEGGRCFGFGPRRTKCSRCDRLSKAARQIEPGALSLPEDFKIAAHRCEHELRSFLMFLFSLDCFCSYSLSFMICCLEESQHWKMSLALF